MGKAIYSILSSFLFFTLVLKSQVGNKTSYIREIDSLNNLFRQEVSTDPVESKKYVRQVLALSEKNNYEKGIASAYLGMGMASIATNVYDTALFYYQKCLPVYTRLKDSLNVAKSFMGLGTIYNYTGNPEKALKYYFDALKTYENLKNQVLTVAALSNIGMIYERQNRFNKALEIYKRCEKINESTKDEMSIADTYGNIGKVYFQLGNYETSIDNHLKELKIREKLLDSAGLCYTFDNLSSAYAVSGKLDLGIQYQLKAYSLYKTISDQAGMANSECNLGNIYFLKNDLKTALFHLQRGIELAESVHANMILSYCYTSLIEVYEKLGDYKTAFYYLDKSSTLKDSIYTKESSQQLAKMETLYETEKLAREKLEIEKENINLSNQKLLSERQRNLIILLAIVLIIFLIAGFYILFQKRKREEEKERINAMLLSEENERTRIARELHDGLGQILSTARINAASLEGSVEKQDEYLLQNTLRLIDESVTEVRNVSHNMMPQMLIDKGLTEAVKELSEKINAGKSLSVSFRASKLIIPLTKSVEVSIFRVIQEVLNNMVKHASADKIDICFESSHSDLKILISDNGKGFDPALIEKSEGLGWKNIMARLSLINAKFEINSRQGKGTSVTLEINYA